MRKIEAVPDEIKRFIGLKLGLFLGRQKDLTPPSWMFHDPDRVDGSRSVEEFISIGDDTVSWFIAEGLMPSHRVLDIGCGIGRMARPLTRHLVGEGSYDGIDIARYKTRYCRQTIGRRFANFRFHHINVFNKYYNPRGKLQAANYRFPFDADTFDFIFLVSVFTHMLPMDMEHYFSEIARLLKPGAKCIASFWLTDAKLGNPYYDYSEVSEIYNREEPEHGVIYVEDYVRKLYRQHDLEIGRVHHGYWIKRDDSELNHLQDIVIARKPGHKIARNYTSGLTGGRG